MGIETSAINAAVGLTRNSAVLGEAASVAGAMGSIGTVVDPGIKALKTASYAVKGVAPLAMA